MPEIFKNLLPQYDPKRYLIVDELKGFAIFLVVLAHVIQRNTLTYLDNPIFLIIKSFHMPLFMFLSGYVAFGRIGQKPEWLKKKFLLLIVPFFRGILFIIFGLHI